MAPVTPGGGGRVPMRVHDPPGGDVISSKADVGPPRTTANRPAAVSSRCVTVAVDPAGSPAAVTGSASVVTVDEDASMHTTWAGDEHPTYTVCPSAATRYAHVAVCVGVSAASSRHSAAV